MAKVSVNREKRLRKRIKELQDTVADLRKQIAQTEKHSDWIKMIHAAKQLCYLAEKRCAFLSARSKAWKSLAKKYKSDA